MKQTIIKLLEISLRPNQETLPMPKDQDLDKLVKAGALSTKESTTDTGLSKEPTFVYKVEEKGNKLIKELCDFTQGKVSVMN